jgi:hypothetical protein
MANIAIVDDENAIRINIPRQLASQPQRVRQPRRPQAAGAVGRRGLRRAPSRYLQCERWRRSKPSGGRSATATSSDHRDLRQPVSVGRIQDFLTMATNPGPGSIAQKPAALLESVANCLEAAPR